MRQPYPLDWREQNWLFSVLPTQMARMALFDVNTGLRDQELCGLEWAWERRLVEITGPLGSRSVFLLPGAVTKNGLPRVVVLNDVAQALLEEVRGDHHRYVFRCDMGRRQGGRFRHLRNYWWVQARRLAAARYREELCIEPPEGFKRVRVHDLRHTFGRRLRAAGVSLEDRRDLLGHKGEQITTHYSMAEIQSLVAAANRIRNYGSSTLTVLRVIEREDTPSIGMP